MTVAAPARPEELEDFIGDLDAKTMFDEATGKPTSTFIDKIKEYAENVRKADEGRLEQQIEEQVQAAVADMLKDQHGGTGRVDMRPLTAAAKTASRHAPGTKVDEVFDDHGDFLQALWHGRGSLSNGKDLTDKLARVEEIQNSYGTQIPADGGFLVPETMRQEILTLALEQSVTRPNALVMPMSSATLTIPAVDDTTHASGALFGGIQCYWAAESAQFTSSQAKFARVKLEAEKLISFAVVPNELPADAPAFLTWMMDNLPSAVTWTEDNSFINGTGAGQPQGWLSAPAAISVAKQTGQAATTIVWENIVKAYSRMLPTSQGRAIWVANIDCFPELATMALSVGTGGGPVWMGGPATPGTAMPPVTILGRPVRFTEKVPTVGTVGDINYVDLKYYGIGDRQAMRMENSTDFKFDTDETAYRTVQRLDGRPILLSALTPANSSNTLSAFVKVATRS